MTSRFNVANFMTTTSDGLFLSPVSAKFKNARFNVPVDKVVTLTAADTSNLPGLAHKYLGDKGLWWFLLEYNGWYDAINDVQAGMVMNIPSRTALIAYLETSAEKPSNVIL